LRDEDCASAPPQSSDGDFDRTVGDLTIDATEAAVVHRSAPLLVQHPKPGSQESTRIPLGKEHDLTKFTIGGAAEPQLQSEGGSAGGNAGVVVNNENNCLSLADGQRPLGSGVNFDSNVVVPDQGTSSGHQTTFSLQQSSATPGNGSRVLIRHRDEASPEWWHGSMSEMKVEHEAQFTPPVHWIEDEEDDCEEEAKSEARCQVETELRNHVSILKGHCAESKSALFLERPDEANVPQPGSCNRRTHFSDQESLAHSKKGLRVASQL
jgi:hypothetical protein